MKLTQQSTIADVLEILHDPEKYLFGVIKNLNSCIHRHGNAQVRIGTRGRGAYPHYRILYEHQKDDGSIEVIVDNSYWDFHKPYSPSYASTKPGTWSLKGSSVAEVEALLERVLNIQPN
ncbi:hypothetical protein A8M32_20430 [Sinorhizobium alkalisoli]|uniref:Uncharacterized protein n=1 Tax=Sinorhizobium alkalisoli TaxID=1752398 RepID=A0A1E3V5Q7_9HYPH|nr:hypothetical protein A8M32_20430 [Sinorhizobium alkalisoli]